MNIETVRAVLHRRLRPRRVSPFPRRREVADKSRSAPLPPVSFRMRPELAGCSRPGLCRRPTSATGGWRPATRHPPPLPAPPWGPRGAGKLLGVEPSNKKLQSGPSDVGCARRKRSRHNGQAPAGMLSPAAPALIPGRCGYSRAGRPWASRPPSSSRADARRRVREAAGFAVVACPSNGGPDSA
jgi:hypothetical protein